MIAIIVNAGTIILGSVVGLIVKNKLQKRLTDAIMLGIGLFTIYMAISALVSVEGNVNSIVYLLALIFGGIIGTVSDIDAHIDRWAKNIQNKFSRDNENRFAAGLTGFFIMSCVGAYTIVACFNAALGDNTMLFTKAVMDLIVSMAMASTLGIGVLFAGIPIVLYELVLVCFSGFLSSFLTETMIESLSCVGAILTLAIGTNIVGATKIKVVNYAPCLILAPIIVYIAELI